MKNMLDEWQLARGGGSSSIMIISSGHGVVGGGWLTSTSRNGVLTKYQSG